MQVLRDLTSSEWRPLFSLLDDADRGDAFKICERKCTLYVLCPVATVSHGHHLAVMLCPMDGVQRPSWRLACSHEIEPLVNQDDFIRPQEFTGFEQHIQFGPLWLLERHVVHDDEVAPLLPVLVEVEVLPVLKQQVCEDEVVILVLVDDLIHDGKRGDVCDFHSEFTSS